MSNSQASIPELYSRLLLFRHALAAEFKARKQHPPAMPLGLPQLLQSCEDAGTDGLLGRPGARDTLLQIRASLFEVPGREVEARAAWRESLACAVFAAGVARLTATSLGTSACAALLHRAGEMLALKILARVELDYRSKLDGPARREWCSSQSPELQELLLRSWPLPAPVGACVLGWNRFGEFSAASPEGAAVYLGRLLAIRHLQPDICVPEVLEQAVQSLGLGQECLDLLLREDERIRELIRALE